MNRLPLILLSMVLVVGALFSNERARATGGIVVGRAELERVFTGLVLGGSSLPRGDLKISNFNANPATLELPPGRPDFQVITQTQDKELGRRTVVFNVLINGQACQRVTLSGDVALFGEVVCAARTLRGHRIIAAADLKRVRRNLTMLGPDLVTDLGQAIGKEIKTTLQPGAVLYGRFLKAPVIVKHGAIVSILALTDSIRVTVPGRVESPGAIGDMVKVKNLMSRKEIYAKVIGPDTVQTEL